MVNDGSLSPPISVRVHQIRWEAQDVISVELRPVDGAALPPFTAGAHIDLHLPNGIERSYSLINDQGERHRFVVAVGRDPASRGGSKYIHETLRVGQVLNVTGPRNNFPLVEDAERVVLIAGGIGITPLYNMARRLASLGRPCDVFYGARTPERAAFLVELEGLGCKLTTHFDSAQGGQPMELGSIISAYPLGTHFYCCGPLGMLSAFEAATAGLPDEFIHVEYFTSKIITAPAVATGFTVVLARSGKELEVPPDRSILDVLLANGVKVDNSCRDGICGSCETRVIEGLLDHRDSVLTKSEQESNSVMMVCVSRCKGKRLVLDLG